MTYHARKPPYRGRTEPTQPAFLAKGYSVLLCKYPNAASSISLGFGSGSLRFRCGWRSLGADCRSLHVAMLAKRIATPPKRPKEFLVPIPALYFHCRCKRGP